MQTQKLGLLLAAGLITVGCRAPLSQWQNSPQARGSFSYRQCSVNPTEDGLIDTAGSEVAGSYQHTPNFATEISSGSWVGYDETYTTSRLLVNYTRASLLYTYNIKPNILLRAGGGMTITGANYRPSYTELQDLAGIGADYASMYIDGSSGVHTMLDITYVQDNGFTAGFFVINTSAELDATILAGSPVTSSEGTVDLSNTTYGLAIGARF